MDEWQPIETAPKGGGAERVDDPNWVDPPEILLGWCQNGNRAIGSWDWYYAKGGDGYRGCDAWTSHIGGELLEDVFLGPPTHWMPLPAPPNPAP